MLRFALLFPFSLALPADDLGARAAAVLRQHCTACHGAALKMSKLDLRTREAMLAGGERGSALEPGAAEKSRLYRFAAGLDQPAMPPGKRPPREDLDVLRRWIDAGAPPPVATVPEDAAAALLRLEERPITTQERSFWAFRKPERPPVPSVSNRNWPQNPVDHFLLAAMEARGLQPAPRADARTLIRRAYLDLLGLPPSPEAVQAFVADTRPDAWERLVDELLASPHYGERWGRHWLDVVRYADSGGYEYDSDKPNAWRYRDYVVASFQNDKPYDRFVREQLAGDEMTPPSTEARIATGFLRLGLEANIKNEMTRMDELDDLVSTTSSAFLGLTVGCARCHNHKFDPIPQKDYYRIQAVFFPSKPASLPLVGEAELERHEAANRRIEELQAPLKQAREALEKPYVERLLEAKKARLPEYVQAALRTPPQQRTEGQRLNAIQVEKTLRVEAPELLASMDSADASRHRELTARIAALEQQRPPALPAALTVREEGIQAPPSYFLHRGSPDQKGSRMEPGVLSVLAEEDPVFAPPPAGAASSWRRRSFAEWVASPHNPLTARVMVNRIWMHHFGDGIVRTPNNFGKMGERPSHPELLDWLAVEFVERGWSIKAMHRLLMTSAAYRMSSDDVASHRKLDPGNRWWWRMPRRRLEGEVLRDAMLTVAGRLDPTLGGPPVFPYIDPALYQESSKRTWPGRPDNDPSTWRRSIYVYSKRSIPLPILDLFDKPDSVSSCARRNRSTIAPQALILMNSSFANLMARYFAQRVQREAGGDARAQVARAFAIAFGRQPGEAEAADAVAFLRAGPFGLVDLCHALFNANEFAYAP